jgi:hypothetical protein
VHRLSCIERGQGVAEENWERRGMNMYAKLFGPEDNQVLVKLDANDEGNPEVRVFCKPVGLGVCSAAWGWNNDSDESWDKAEKSFAGIDQEQAISMAQKICAQLGVTLPQGPNNNDPVPVPVKGTL